MESGFRFIKLPRYSREFTARTGSAVVQTVIFGLLGLLIAFLVAGANRFTALQKALNDTQDAPFAPRTHLNLAQAYLDLRQFNSAQKEINIGKFLNTANLNHRLKELEKLENNLADLPLSEAKTYNHWLSVVSKYPDYKEGWIMLMYLAKNQNNPQKLGEFRQNLKNLNPNYLNSLPPDL